MPIEDLLAKQLLPDTPSQLVGRRRGTILTVNDAAATVDVALGTATLPGVKHLASYFPAAGDQVFVDFTGPDPVVVGTTATVTPAAPGRGWFRSGSAQGNSLSTLGGVELYHSAGTPFIDFHAAATPAADSNADYRGRIILAGDAFEVLGSSGFRGLNVLSRNYIGHSGAYGWDYAQFSHWNMRDSSAYGVMQHLGGELLLSSASDNGIYLRQANQPRMQITGGEVHTSVRLNVSGGLKIWSDWLRFQHSEGLHFDNRGGGWWMPGNDWIESYNSKGIYTGGVVRGGDAYIQTWANAGGHSVFSCWGAPNDKGWMVRWDQALWCMMGVHFIVRQHDGGEYYHFYRWGDVRLAVPTVAPGDPDLRIAGSNQLLRNASNRRLKKNIRKLDANPVFDIPVVRYHWKDDAREHGARFNERNPKGRPGFIAEDLFAVAPDACTVDTTTNEPNGPDVWSLLAYLVDGVQTLKQQLDRVEKGKA